MASVVRGGRDDGAIVRMAARYSRLRASASWPPSVAEGVGAVRGCRYSPRVSRPVLTLLVAIGLAEGCASTEEVERSRADYEMADRCLELGADKAPELCRETCSRGIAAGCWALGRAFMTIGQPNLKAALGEFDSACALGDATSCVQAGVLLEQGADGPTDPTRAMRYYRLACDMNHPTGCSNLGLAYQLGEVVPKDELRASQLYQRGCAGGDPAGCANLAFLLHYGIGVSKNDKRARELYEEACKQKHERACGNLAAMLLAGRGGYKDEARALEIYRASCDAGLVEGCGNLAVMLESGTGIERSLETLVEARRLYTRTCDAGIVDACLGLGRMYETGGGGPVDLEQAGRLYRRVCGATQEREACERWDRVKRALEAGRSER